MLSGSAMDSRREAMFTWLPTIVYSIRLLEPKLPTVQKPVFMPILTRSLWNMPRSRHCSRSPPSSFCMSRAILAHWRAWVASSVNSGSPKNTITPSPMNLSMVPPHFMATSAMRFRYWLSTSESSSDSTESVIAEKFTMSEKKIVSFLRLCTSTASVVPPTRDW
jgi:hypothetical protein